MSSAGRDGQSADSARDRVRARLIAAARPLLAERGASRVSLREIAAAADVNYGLIHQYVGTKEDLLRLVFRTASSEWADQFAQASTPQAAVAYLMRPKSAEYVRMVAHLLLEGRDPAALVGRSPALRELSRRLSEEVGSTASDHDARVQAAALTAMALGWGLFGPFVQRIADLGDLPADEATDAVYAILRRAVIGEDPATPDS